MLGQLWSISVDKTCICLREARFVYPSASSDRCVNEVAERDLQEWGVGRMGRGHHPVGDHWVWPRNKRVAFIGKESLFIAQQHFLSETQVRILSLGWKTGILASQRHFYVLHRQTLQMKFLTYLQERRLCTWRVLRRGGYDKDFTVFSCKQSCYELGNRSPPALNSVSQYSHYSFIKKVSYAVIKYLKCKKVS